MKTTSTASEIIKEFLEHKRYREESGWDAMAQKAQDFYFGDQYNAEIKELLRQANRADSRFNHVLPAIELLCGHNLQMQTDMVAKPYDRFADPYVARMLSSGLKQIEQSNDVPFEDAAQYLDGQITAVGIKDKYYDTDTDIEGKITVHQDSSFDYYFDMNFRRYDYTDANVLFRSKWLTRDQIEDTYPDFDMSLLEISENNSFTWFAENIVRKGYGEEADYGNQKGYSEPTNSDRYPDSGYDSQYKRYRVIERFKRVSEWVEYYPEPKEDGSGYDWKQATELNESEYLMIKDTVQKIKQFKIILDTVIVNEMAVEQEDTGVREFYHRFSIYFPYFHNGRYMGSVENLISPQEEINKRHSTLIHILSTLGVNKLFYTDEFLPADTEIDIGTEWAKTGTAIRANALMDSDGKNTFHIAQPPNVPPEFERDMSHQEENIKHISGSTNQLFGQSQRRESGKAKQAEIQQGALRLHPMINNFRKTRRLDGKSYIFYMQKYYGEDKYIRVYGEHLGETDREVVLNKQAIDFVANDIHVGEYDVTIEFEGKTPSERAATYWRLVELANTVPEYRDIIGEIVLKTADMPEKDIVLQKISERQKQLQQNPEMMLGGQPPNGEGIRREPQRVQ